MREFKETFGDIKEYPIKLSSAGLMYYLYYLDLNIMVKILLKIINQN